MENALIAAGTHREAAKGFVKSVMSNTVPGNFVELYGRGAIVQEANKQRRRLNVEGFDALISGRKSPMASRGTSASALIDNDAKTSSPRRIPSAEW